MCLVFVNLMDMHLNVSQLTHLLVDTFNLSTNIVDMLLSSKIDISSVRSYLIFGRNFKQKIFKFFVTSYVIQFLSIHRFSH